MNADSLIQKLIPNLYEDDRFLVVDKPAGIDVGGLPEKGVTGLVELLSDLHPRESPLSPSKGEGRGEAQGNRPLFVINRLSRYESGVLILGKDAESAAFVRNGLKAMRVQQEYLAVVIGRMTDRQIVFDGGKGATRGRSREQVKSLRTRAGVAGRSAAAKPSAAPVPNAPTTLTRLQQSERRALLRVRTSVPNTHALRAMLRSVRLRLLGDNVHDASTRPQQNESTRLHLAKVTFHHPALKTRITIASPPPDSFAAVLGGGVDIERPLRAALTRRIACLKDADTDCFRLISGGSEDLTGLNAEKYGDLILLQLLDARADDRELLMRVVRWYRSLFEVWAVYAKPFVKERTRLDETTARRIASPKPLWGDPVPPQIEVRERGLRFAIRPYEGFNVGLFLDHRHNRARVREMASGADVLNLFAYTCGFSVAAAAGGAKSTVSVDLSPKNLEWGRTNFALNGIELADHTFIRSDAADYLKRAKRQGLAFDLIIIDPPSFAHGKSSGGDFSIMTDLPKLVSNAVDVLRPGGTIMVSTNYRRMSLAGLKERVRQGAGSRRMKITSAPPLPPDFAVDRDHSKTVFAQC